MIVQIKREEIKRLSRIFAVAILFFFLIQELIPAALKATGLSDILSEDGTGYNGYSILAVAVSLLFPFLSASAYIRKFTDFDPAPLGKPKGVLLTLSVTSVSIMFILFSGEVFSFLISKLENAGILISAPDMTPPAGGAALFMYILRIAVFAPVCEELIFRGIIMQSLKKYGRFFSVFCSALLFAALHRNLVQAPVAIISGIVIGYAVYCTDSLWTGIIIHFINNTIALITGYFSSMLDPLIASKLYYIIIVAFAVLAAAGGLFIALKAVFGGCDLFSRDTPVIPFGKSFTAFLFTPPMILAFALVCVYTAKYVRLI